LEKSAISAEKSENGETKSRRIQQNFKQIQTQLGELPESQVAELKEVVSIKSQRLTTFSNKLTSPYTPKQVLLCGSVLTKLEKELDKHTNQSIIHLNALTRWRFQTY
jgi:hypothetical protein